LATIVMDRSSGALLSTTGNISLSRTSSVADASQSLNTTGNAVDEVSSTGNLEGLERLAAMVWRFVNAADSLVEDLEAEVCSLHLSL
jgi:dynein light chain roadblock-type